MQNTQAINRLDLGVELVEFDLEMSRRGFIGHILYPLLPRDQPDGRIPILKLEALLQEWETETADGAGSRRGEADYAFLPYNTKLHTHERLLPDRRVKKHADIINSEFWERNILLDILLRRYERRVADSITALKFVGQTTVLATAWSDEVNSDPRKILDDLKETFVLRVGLEPNCLQVGRRTFDYLINNQNLINRFVQQNFQDARPEKLNAASLAVSLNIPRVIVGDAVTNTANVAAPRNLQRVWANSQALLCRVVENPGNESEPGLGRTPVWSEEGAIDGDQIGVIVEEYREEGVRSSVMRGRTDYELMDVFTTMGQLITNVV